MALAFDYDIDARLACRLDEHLALKTGRLLVAFDGEAAERLLAGENILRIGIGFDGHVQKVGLLSATVDGRTVPHPGGTHEATRSECAYAAGRNGRPVTKPGPELLRPK